MTNQIERDLRDRIYVLRVALVNARSYHYAGSSAYQRLTKALETDDKMAAVPTDLFSAKPKTDMQRLAALALELDRLPTVEERQALMSSMIKAGTLSYSEMAWTMDWGALDIEEPESTIMQEAHTCVPHARYQCETCALDEMLPDHNRGRVHPRANILDHNRKPNQEEERTMSKKNDNASSVSVGIVDEHVFIKMVDADGDGAQARLSPDEAKEIHRKLGRALEYFAKDELPSA